MTTVIRWRLKTDTALGLANWKSRDWVFPNRRQILWKQACGVAHPRNGRQPCQMNLRVFPMAITLLALSRWEIVRTHPAFWGITIRFQARVLQLLNQKSQFRVRSEERRVGKE